MEDIKNELFKLDSIRFTRDHPFTTGWIDVGNLLLRHMMLQLLSTVGMEISGVNFNDQFMNERERSLRMSQKEKEREAYE